jgi:hypothetical protein
MKKDKPTKKMPVVALGGLKKLTSGGPDGQYLDGNSPSNPRRFKKGY